jgi:PAS domain S-box-containing protein
MQLASSKTLKNHYIPNSEFYSQLIESLHDYSIFTVDNNLIINSWSSGSTAIFGYQSREVIGKHFDLIFTPEDKKNGIPKKRNSYRSPKRKSSQQQMACSQKQ